MADVKGGKYIVNGVTVDANGVPLKGDAEPIPVTEDEIVNGGTGMVTPNTNTQPQTLSSLNKDELVKLAEGKGLDTSGTKTDLIERLEAAE